MYVDGLAELMLIAYILPIGILVHIGERVYECVKARNEFHNYEQARLAYSAERMNRIRNLEF